VRPRVLPEGQEWNRIVGQAEKLRKQVATLAGFGGRALRSSNIDELLQDATQLVSDVVEVDLVKVLGLLVPQSLMAKVTVVCTLPSRLG
jgi:hypothetical protein